MRLRTRVIVALSLCLGVATCIASLPEPAPKTPAELAADKMRSAMYSCKAQTESQLADPEGFEPEAYGQWRALASADDAHTFRFTARARNAFAALVWAEFECQVTFDGTSWRAAIRQL